MTKQEARRQAQVDDALAIYRAGLDAVRPDRLMERVEWERLFEGIDTFDRMLVVGAGKAAMAMAGAVEARFGRRIDAGLVVVPHGYVASFPDDRPRPERIEVVEAGHPLPDAAGVAAAERTLAMVREAGASDLVLVLLSGGGTALWPAFVDGISLQAAQTTFELLLHSGADIHQINTVRKHLSRIGGGRLATTAFPATVVALVLSDVVGDNLSVVASGPTVPDPTTFLDAIHVLQQFELWEKVPPEVRAHLRSGRDTPEFETPKAGHPAFRRTLTMLLGSNRQALAAAADEARRRGYRSRVVTDRLTGEARVVGERIARQLCGTPADPPVCLLWGGETTVTLERGGEGGRNQELALAAALVLEGHTRPVVLLSAGTDGLDGPTDAAGAVVHPETIPEARCRGLDPDMALQNHDTYPFFKALDALVVTGPTHTNVMDLLIGLVGVPDRAAG
ncbi:MAG: hydroxypyruvate reductase [Rhodothermaceae bacterium]|nr:MAG: hydroxypyruvate reductase [Rhodothermaceae bacterium]